MKLSGRALRAPWRSGRAGTDVVDAGSFALSLHRGATGRRIRKASFRL
jgi:hypothetical protein